MTERMMDDQMLIWIREFGMFEVLQSFRRALIRAMGLTTDLDVRNRMATLVNFLGQKV